jgi:hypothetical protein
LATSLQAVTNTFILKLTSPRGKSELAASTGNGQHTGKRAGKALQQRSEARQSHRRSGPMEFCRFSQKGAILIVGRGILVLRALR